MSALALPQPPPCRACLPTPGWREVCAWISQPDGSWRSPCVTAACTCAAGQWRVDNRQAVYYTEVLDRAEEKYGPALAEVHVSEGRSLSPSQRNPSQRQIRVSEAREVLARLDAEKREREMRGAA